MKLMLLGLCLTAARGVPLDFQLDTSRGDKVVMAAYRGKPTVLFYEDREGTTLNRALKAELFKRGREAGLLKAVNVVAVANLRGYDWFPAKNFAIDGVKKAEAKAGIPVLIDWTGALSAQPWDLPKSGSSVLLLDAKGQVIVEKSGAFSHAQIDAFFEQVQAQLRPASN